MVIPGRHFLIEIDYTVVAAVVVVVVVVGRNSADDAGRLPVSFTALVIFGAVTVQFHMAIFLFFSVLTTI